MKASVVVERVKRINSSEFETGAKSAGVKFIGDDCQTTSVVCDPLTTAHQILSVLSVTRTGVPPSRTSNVAFRTFGSLGHANTVDGGIPTVERSSCAGPMPLIFTETFSSWTNVMWMHSWLGSTVPPSMLLSPATYRKSRLSIRSSKPSYKRTKYHPLPRART